MRKKVISIATVALFFVSAILAIVLYIRIKDKNDEKTYIAEVEEKVIESLKVIRRAEIAYFSIHNQYTDNWDSLRIFVKEANFAITNRREIITPNPNGGDSVTVEYDTLGVISVLDSLYKKDYPNLDINSIGKLPHKDTLFSIYAAVFEEGAVIEVEDSKPVNPMRQEGGVYKPLKFGSQSAPTTKGNWEK